MGDLLLSPGEYPLLSLFLLRTATSKRGAPSIAHLRALNQPKAGCPIFGAYFAPKVGMRNSCQPTFAGSVSGT